MIFVFSESSNDGKWTIHCECCAENASENVDPNVDCLPRIYDKIFNKYFQLLSSTNTSIRLNMSKSILSLSNHIKSFNSNEVAKNWLPYIYDDNEEIRSNIASVIGRLLSNKISLLENNERIPDTVPEDLDEFVDLVIDVIANTLMTAVDTFNHSLHDTLLVTAKNFIW